MSGAVAIRYAVNNQIDMTNKKSQLSAVICYRLLTAYLIATAPDITEQERKEMEDEWWS